jgi:hypothetical protein
MRNFLLLLTSLSTFLVYKPLFGQNLAYLNQISTFAHKPQIA